MNQPTQALLTEFTNQQLNQLLSQPKIQMLPQPQMRSAELLQTPHSLSKLNNFELESGLKKLIHQERKILHLILLHIKEVDNRKLYLKKAYPSLFEYLLKEHGYSAGSAMRRIEAARLLRDVPQMAKKIQSGEINLSQITEISRAVKEKQRETRRFVSIEEKEDLVLKVAGLNLAETQKIVSLELNIKPKEYEKKRTQQNESVRLELTLTKAQMEKLNRCKDLTAHIIEQKKMDSSFASVIEVLMDQFLAKRNLQSSESIEQNKRKNKLDNQPKAVSQTSTCKQTCTGNHTGAGIQTSEDNQTSTGMLKVQKPVQENFIFKMEKKAERACLSTKMEIEKVHPVSKVEVNHSISGVHKAKANWSKSVVSEMEVSKKAKTIPEIKVNKTLTLKTKSQIHQRDQCCQYVDPVTNKKCESTYKMEIDHIQPRWAKGNHHLSNLQILCKNHNSFKYKAEARISKATYRKHNSWLTLQGGFGDLEKI